MVESRVTLGAPCGASESLARLVLPENNARHVDKSPVTSPDVQRYSAERSLAVGQPATESLPTQS